MAFSDFKYPDVLDTLGLTEETVRNMFASVAEVPASATLRAFLANSVPQATMATSEMARSSLMVAPIISEVWGRYDGKIGTYYGFEFNADAEAGLNGYCDFLISRTPQKPRVVAPVVVVVEAKRDNLENGYGQCIASMVGALRFNHRERNGIDTIYGASTTGTNWRFLRLQGTIVTLDVAEYTISEVNRLLGILMYIVGPVPGAAAA
jgi:hypothetical protein